MSDKQSTAYSEYVPTWERPVITALVKALLDRGYSLAIHNGEEYSTPRTRKLTTLRPVFGQAEEDNLVVFDENKERLGSWYLIYNNGSDDSPIDVIADYSWGDGSEYGDACSEIWEALFNQYSERG